MAKLYPVQIISWAMKKNLNLPRELIEAHKGDVVLDSKVLDTEKSIDSKKKNKRGEATYDCIVTVLEKMLSTSCRYGWFYYKRLSNSFIDNKKAIDS